MTRRPGLDLEHLQAMRRSRHDLSFLRRRIARHLEAHDGYVALSGGKDSTVLAHLVHSVDPNTAVAFFDSGLEFPETYQHINNLADQLNLNLHVYPAKPTLLQLLIASGAWNHHAESRRVPDLTRTLIKEPASRAHFDHGEGELWGVRADEAKGRRIAYERALCAEIHLHASNSTDATLKDRQAHGGVIRRQDGTVAYGPLWNWSTADIWQYLGHHHVPTNPVYDKLQRLGAPERIQRVSHLVDGANLDDGRITWLRRGWPDLYEQLRTHLPRIEEHG